MPIRETLDRIRIRRSVRAAFYSLWREHVQIVELSERPEELFSCNEQCEYDETEVKREKFYDAVSRPVEIYVSDPKEVERAVKLAFQIAPRERWYRRYKGAGISYWHGADAALDQWEDYTRTDTFEGSSAQGLEERTEEFGQSLRVTT